MRTNLLPKRAIFKSMALRKEYPFPQFNNTVSRGRGERRISTPTLD